MAVLKIEYHSEVLNLETRVNVLYPDRVFVQNLDCTDVPVLYLLHGMGGNENSWLKRSNIERLTRFTNLIIVMPYAHNGWYINAQNGYHYYDAIAKELPRTLKYFFPNMSDKREKNFIAGLSMGGYGSFLIAMRTNRFSYAASLSGALSFEGCNDLVNSVGNLAYWEGVFGDVSSWSNNPYNILNVAKESDGKTKFLSWCGVDDYLYRANEFAIKNLKKAGLNLQSVTGVGKHEWYYWDQQIENVLEWLPIDFKLEERLS